MLHLLPLLRAGPLGLHLLAEQVQDLQGRVDHLLFGVGVFSLGGYHVDG